MNAQQFKERFLPYYPKVYRIALAIVGTPCDAEDITQSLYAKLWEERGKLYSVETPEAYIVRMVRNMAIDHTRTAPFKAKRAELEVVDNLPHNTTGSHTDELTTVMHLIERLPAKQALALKLHAIQDVEYTEIEEIMNESATNVRMLISRARKHIKGVLKTLQNK